MTTCYFCDTNFPEGQETCALVGGHLKLCNRCFIRSDLAVMRGIPVRSEYSRIQMVYCAACNFSTPPDFHVGGKVICDTCRDCYKAVKYEMMKHVPVDWCDPIPLPPPPSRSPFANRMSQMQSSLSKCIISNWAREIADEIAVAQEEERMAREEYAARCFRLKRPTAAGRRRRAVSAKYGGGGLPPPTFSKIK